MKEIYIAITLFSLTVGCISAMTAYVLLTENEMMRETQIRMRDNCLYGYTKIQNNEKSYNGNVIRYENGLPIPKKNKVLHAIDWIVDYFGIDASIEAHSYNVGVLAYQYRMSDFIKKQCIPGRKKK